MTVNPVLVATSIKQTTCIKQACICFPEKANTLKSSCLQQAQFDYSLGACLIQVGLLLRQGPKSLHIVVLPGQCKDKNMILSPAIPAVPCQV